MMRFTNNDTLRALLGLMLVGYSAAGWAQDNYTAHLDQPMPSQWTGVPEFDHPEAPPQEQWWRQFDDQLLNELVDRGLSNNYNVAMAARRIDIARRTLESVNSGYYPTLAAQAGWELARSSGRIVSPAVKSSTSSYFNLGVTMSWEIDVFGRIKAQASSKKAALEVSKADYDGTMLSLAAQITSQYIQVRTWQAELEVANAHIGRQLKVVKLTEARKEAGLASGLDVAQAMIVYNSTIASVPMLENSITTGINALAILVGEYPEQLRPMLESPRPLPSYIQIVGAGVPMDLLRRRPDIRAAQQQLVASADAIGIARKDYLPTLTLNGQLGTAAHNVGDMFSSHSYTYSIAPTLSWTIFDGFKRRYNVDIAREQMKMEIENYNLVVLTAVEEADNAMATYLAQVKHIANIGAVIDQSNKALEFSIDLYKRGLNPFSDVVSAQMTLLQYQDQEVVAQGQALQALITLFKALGGAPS